MVREGEGAAHFVQGAWASNGSGDGGGEGPEAAGQEERVEGFFGRRGPHISDRNPKAG